MGESDDVGVFFFFFENRSRFEKKGKEEKNDIQKIVASKKNAPCERHI